MRELVVDLRRLTRQSSAGPVPSAPSVPVTKQNRLPLIAGVVAALLALSSAGYWKLSRSDYFWVNPLEGARFEKLTDWPGTELDAAISHDGKFVTFLSDRDGAYDMFVTQVGSGEFRNLSQGAYPTLLHEMTRATGFNADGTQIWMRTVPPDLSAPNLAKTPILSLMPTMGGPRRPFLTPQSLNPVWSADGAELVFHHSNQGDPIMTSQPDGRMERRVFTARPGEHNHYVNWSPDRKFIYFSRGFRASEFDIWRVPSSGGGAERLTHHNSYVAYPVMLDNRTLLYRATKEDGSGWAIYGMDVENRIPHRLSLGVEEYQSLSVSADGRRLVVAVSNPVASIWRIPIGTTIAAESAATKLAVSSAQVKSGRYSRDSILYLSGKGGEGGLWIWKDGAAVSVWHGSAGRVTSGAATSPDGSLIAFSVSENGRNVLHIASYDGTGAHTVAESLDLRSSPSWSPDGKWIAVAAHTENGSRIFKIPVHPEAGEPVQLTDVVTFNPVWSPDGSRIVYYDGSGGGATFPLRAITPDKAPVPMPKPQVTYRGDYEGYRFLPDGKSLIVLQGQFRAMDFWRIELATGERKQLTNLKPGYAIRGFDISPDGKEILFDRVLENSDVVLVHRKP